ncbi:MAG: hypothetical protein V4649_14255 [Bacteroidota bacterium]
MKKLVLIVVAVAFTISAWAQGSLDDGIKMYNYKKYMSAQRILTPLAEKDAMANYYLGLSYLGAGDLSMAGTTFSRFPEDFANISGNARVAYARKDMAKGNQMVKDLAAKAKKKDWMPQKYAADAITYSEGGDYNQAIAWYKDVLTKNMNETSAHIGIGDAYRKVQGGGGEAMTNYEFVTEKDAKNSLAYSRIGDLWYDARNYPSALDNYAKAKEADPTNPMPYSSLADAYARSGRYKQALESIQQYLKLSDNTAEDQLRYTRILYLAQSYCDAAVKAKEIMATPLGQDVKTEMYGILGFSQAECGDSLEALTNLRTYFQMQDASKVRPGAYIQYGKLFLKLNMLDSAGVYYTKGISGDTAKNKTDIYRQIAEAFKAKKEYCKSAEWYDNLIKANPGSQPGDYAWRSIMFYYCKDYTRGIESANDFAAKHPDQPSAPYWQGRIQMAIDSDATSGVAEQYFLKWYAMPGDKKPNDLKSTYIYLMYYYYHKNDKENMKLYMDKIRAIDPADRSVKEIEEASKAPAPSKEKIKIKSK